MDTFHVTILAADKRFYEGPCESLVVPTSDGQSGILAHHKNVIAALTPGTLQYRVPGGENQIAAVSRGFIKVEDNTVLILVDTIERPGEIDAIRAQREIDEAQEIMLQKKSIQSYHSAQARMARAINRLRVKAHQVD